MDGSSVGSRKESSGVCEMSEGRELYRSPKSRLKPNPLVTAQEVSSQVRGPHITWASTCRREPAELLLLAQKWSVDCFTCRLLSLFVSFWFVCLARDSLTGSQAYLICLCVEPEMV